MKFKNKNIFLLIFCFVISFVLLMIVSRSSFLYPFNNWNDANAFFTMGKSLMNGKVIFKDIFEQKGPLLYLIYGIGYLISNKTFLGIFILEVISSTIFSYTLCKIINLYLDKKYIYFILPIFLMILYTSKAFSYGGSCEEFCLPFLGYSLYKLLVYSKEKKIRYIDIYIVGLVSGLVFLMKYTLLGISFSFCVYVFVSLLLNKEYKRGFLFPFVFLIGMLTPILPWILYFLKNNALYDFINSYILINAFSYGISNVSIVSRIFNCFYFFIRNLYSSSIYAFVMFFMIIIFLLDKSKIILSEKIGTICAMFFSVLFIYICGSYFYYYVFPIYIFLIFAFIGIFILIDKFLIKRDKNITIIFGFIITILSIISSYYLSPNTQFMNYKAEELPQYQFAKIINESKNQTILNYGFLDMGFYTVTGITPNTKYFEKLNFKYERYPENVDSLNSYIENKNVEYVIYVKTENQNFPVSDKLDINYDLIAEYNNKKIDNYSYYLYKLK